MMAVVLAHQGGWDEVLLVLLPIGLFAFLLWVANKRAARLQQDETDSPTDQHEEP
jgi:cyanate permease